MKKWFKISLYTLVGVAAGGFVCAFAVPWNHSTIISCVGSSGVKPFVEEYAKAYSKTNNVDINIDAGGSGFGISQVANNFTNIGCASKNPFEAVKETYRQNWISNKIKTVTIGWEGICILYIPPKGISDDVNLNQVLTLNQDNITNLYRTFSGFKDGLPTGKPYLSLFLNPKYQIPETDKTKFEEQEVIPYARSGGSLTSGTAASFFEGSHFNNYSKGLTEAQKTAFINGNYGKDFKLYDTDEANSRAWSVFNKNNIPGSMVYLSSSFVQKNYDLINLNNYGILSYNSHEYNVEDINVRYNFFRSLNLMLSINSNDQTTKFILDIINYSMDVGFTNLGAKGIDHDQYNSMFIDSNFWVDDVALMEQRSSSWDQNDTIFGAIESYDDKIKEKFYWFKKN